MIFYLPLIASSMFTLNTPQDKRERVLNPFFSPAPGSEVFIFEEDAFAAARGKAEVKRLRGYITVSPPKNVCFSVKRSDDSPDEHICSKKVLSFTLSDMDRAGRITWLIKTSHDDMGTTLSWQTPYRIAILMPRTPDNKTLALDSSEFWQDAPPQYKFIKSCTDVSIPSTRRLELKMFTGETWIFYFPDIHKLLPQPEETPNLVIVSSGPKRSLAEAAKDKKEEEKKQSASQEVPAAKQEGTGTNKKDERPDNIADRKLWTISLRHSYEMSVESFHTDNMLTSGLKGRCRYNFTGPTEDLPTGRIECQDTPEFHMFLLPVTCLDKVKGDKAKS